MKTLLWCGENNSLAKKIWGQGTTLTLAITLGIPNKNLHHLSKRQDGNSEIYYHGDGPTHME